MKVRQMLAILKDVPPGAEIYVLDTSRDVINVKCVEVEHPVDDESEICVNIALTEE
jgi:hypothetical protein